MRPLTNRQPKPLLEVGGKPLVEHLIDRLRAAGFQDLVINLGWLGTQIRDALGSGDRLGVAIEYSTEPPGALETAGGIRQALPLLGDEPFLVVNADVYCDYPLHRLREQPIAGDAHLVMVANPAHHPAGDFHLSGTQLRLHGEPRLTYSGIGVFRPALFAALEPGWRRLRPVLEQAIGAGRASGELHRGRWLDLGTPERLEQLRREL